MAAGLATMVATMSRGKKSYAQFEAELSEAVGRLGTLREELKAAIDADAEAYNAVMKAYKAAREAADGGKTGINAALRGAAGVPLGVAERAVQVAEIAERLRGKTSPMMASDLTTAVALAKAAITGALSNVEINVGSMEEAGAELSAEDTAFVTQARQSLERLNT
jgi:formiminotetrahydrofolate cyclodeaminase